jgi:glycosyltransferase involved in cell wall biosynthesis
MRVDYLSCRLIRSGGTKIISQHVKLLKERGHAARILTTDQKGEELWGIPVERVRAFKQAVFSETEVIVGTWLRDVGAASKIRGPVICHLCQGYEPIELSFRIRGERIPPKYRYHGMISRFLFLKKKWSFRRRARKMEKIYQLQTVKIAVSQALKEVIEDIYGKPCHLIPNGVDHHIFHPAPEPKTLHSPLRLLSVGPIDMAFKGIDDTFETIRILKQKQIPVEFIRVSLAPPTEVELKSGLMDQFLVGLNETEMAQLYRDSDILIAPSLWEGFGLPVIEAMSCGVPSILTDSGSYKSLDSGMDFAYFVPARSPPAIVEGILKIREDHLLRERIIQRGFEVAGRYTLGNMGNRLEETMLEILKTARRSAQKEEGHDMG